MKVAFDVKGTLAGPDKILKLFKWFESKGCDMVIWSNSYGYAIDAKNDYNLEGDVMTKRCTWDYYGDESQYMDIAIEDDYSQTDYLAAKHFILVNEVPEDESDFDGNYGHFFEEE